MTSEEIMLLQSPAIREAIRNNIERDPLKVAMDKKLPHAALVASQVKYLQRAGKKLPSYHSAGCIIPPLAFEQSSGEQAAAHKDFGGSLCIDLTCGLGVDSLHFSRRFGRVISVERSTELTAVARINFGRLGAGNITVVNSAAEDYIAEFTGGADGSDNGAAGTDSGSDNDSNGGSSGKGYRSGVKADLVYIDPDRRGAGGRKLVRLEDCSPNVIAILPLLKRAAARIVIKTSPLFDTDEAFRIFGTHCRVDVVSAGGECKEVLIELSDDIAVPTVRASVLGVGSAEYPLHREHASGTRRELGAGNLPHMEHHVENPFAPPYRYMAIPDAALRKARLSAAYFGEILPEAYTAPGDGYVFMNDLPAGVSSTPILGRLFEILHMAHYDPKQLKKELKARGLSSAELHLHNFPASAQQICSESGIREGGAVKLAFTRADGGLWMIEVKEIPLRKCR